MSRAENATGATILPAPLLALAAGRDPGPVDLGAGLVETARDHRMLGLLWTHLQRTGSGTVELAMHDLQLQSHQRRVRDHVVWCHDVARAVGVDIAILKGPALEHRYYDRLGERPSSDVDLLVAPDQLDRTPELLRAIQPDHPWLAGLGHMIERRQVQSVTALVDGFEVDIHLDAFKLGVWLRRPEMIWHSTTGEKLWGGTEIRSLDVESTLVLLLVHLTKDRFQRLLGYADIVRLVSSGVDWGRVAMIVRTEGLVLPVSLALHVVQEDLKVDFGLAATPFARSPSGCRAGVWRWLWREQIRLRGSEGRLRYRFRQDLLPMLARGRQAETLRWWARELFPPAVTVAAEYPEIPGPYLARLTRGRLQALQGKRAGAVLGFKGWGR